VNTKASLEEVSLPAAPAMPSTTGVPLINLSRISDAEILKVSRTAEREDSQPGTKNKFEHERLNQGILAAGSAAVPRATGIP
jgi:hypothetical protein